MTASAITEQWLEQTLADMGEDADQVAATLRAAKIMGLRHEPGKCPVAQYLAQQAISHVPSARVIVSVSPSSVSIGIELPDTDDYHYVRVNTPKPVREFIHAFDSGDSYGDLSAEPAN